MNTIEQLLEALKELCEIVEDAIAQKSAKDLDSFTLQPAIAAIAAGEAELRREPEPVGYVYSVKKKGGGYRSEGAITSIGIPNGTSIYTKESL